DRTQSDRTQSDRTQSDRTPSSNEELVLIPRGEKILELSHQRIDDYLTCPMKYRYIHVLKVPIRQHHAVIYGYAIHQAIKRYNVARHAGQEIPLAELKEAFRTAWQSEGFLTRKHEELRFQEGMEALKQFYTYANAEESIPTYVEQHFSFTEGAVKISGIFDQIDIPDTKNPGNGVIIDYKTSAVTNEEQANKRTKASLQLAIYALAYEHLFGEIPAGLELRFLTPEMIIGRYVPSEKTLDKARSDIETAAAGIRSGDFPANPTYLGCTYCAYRSICPAKQTR
ncbi:PD-(D/E)XK nuclease family protein, partial [Candidatus Bipolaricaulota bacterium]|nr:PD-(D/E)XK nuclease family protein [Candidatus Bipolaricaulota bacterium]